MHIITISGAAQHGKDTSGEMIKNIFERQGRKVIRIAYGDYLKFIASKYFNYKGDEFKHEPEQRKLLQTLGTEVGRKYDPSIWVDIVAKFLNAFRDEFDVAIITDARFPNECDILKDNDKHKVINLHVERLGFDNGLGENNKHASENSLYDYEFDHYIKCKSLKKLEKEIIFFLANYFI